MDVLNQCWFFLFVCKESSCTNFMQQSNLRIVQENYKHYTLRQYYGRLCHQREWPIRFNSPVTATHRTIGCHRIYQTYTTKTKEFNCDVFITIKVCEEVVGNDYFWYRSVHCVCSKVLRKGGCVTMRWDLVVFNLHLSPDVDYQSVIIRREAST